MIEEGYCGVGGIGKTKISIAFRNQFEETPRVEIKEAISSDVVPAIINVSKAGFDLLIAGTTEKFNHWRGIYTAILN